jgi:hypothetical protein
VLQTIYEIVSNNLHSADRDMVTFIRKDLGYTEVDSDSELTELKMIKLRSYTSAKFLYICVLYPSPSSRE